MSIDENVALSLDCLAIDVFDVVGAGPMVESLTAGHGIPELGASTGSPGWGGSCSCSCSYYPPEPW